MPLITDFHTETGISILLVKEVCPFEASMEQDVLDIPSSFFCINQNTALIPKVLYYIAAIGSSY